MTETQTAPEEVREGIARTIHTLITDCDHASELMRPWQCRRWADEILATTSLARLTAIEEAARAVLIELDIIRAHRDKTGSGHLIVHIDTHGDLRTALEGEK